MGLSSNGGEENVGEWKGLRYKGYYGQSFGWDEVFLRLSWVGEGGSIRGSIMEAI